MNEETEKKQPANGAPDVPPMPEGQQESAVEERPNRKAFSERFKKRHADIDFEDKESRYGAMNEDADLLSSYEESGKRLSETFDQNRWIAAMIMDLKDKPDLTPIEWMASNGIDIQAALDDPKEGKKVAEQIAKFQERKADEDKHEQELLANIRKSADAMDELGLSDDEKNDLWEKVWKVIGDAEDGVISTETWKLFKNGYSYDDDVNSARQEGTMQGRNEKIQNKVKRSNPEIPPTLSTGAGGSSATPKKRGGGFFDGLTYNT